MPARARSLSRGRGFALLEALVAIVVMAAVGSALFALISSGLQNLQKAERHVAITSVQPDLIAWVRSVNLPELPANHRATMQLAYEGRPYSAEAQFERMHGPAAATGPGGNEGIHALALYDVTVTLYHEEQFFGSFRLRKVAHRQVRPAPQL